MGLGNPPKKTKGAADWRSIIWEKMWSKHHASSIMQEWLRGMTPDPRRVKARERPQKGGF
jgi:hypothetical protein